MCHSGVELGDNLLNETTNQYETELVVTIADQQSIATLPENPDEPETLGEGVPEETGTLIVQVIGSDSSLVANTVLSVKGEEFTTNAQGLLQVNNVPAGEVQVEVLSVPEAYFNGRHHNADRTNYGSKSRNDER